MSDEAHADNSNGRGKSLLDLAPLERDCMKMLWPLGEGTVKEIRDDLAAVRPRAYTTIMTIMDRLARKGVVTRRKVGRAYLYRPNFSAEEARARAVEQLQANFFGGSRSNLVGYLEGKPFAAGREERRPEPRRAAPAENAAPVSAVRRLDDSLL